MHEVVGSQSPLKQLLSKDLRVENEKWTAKMIYTKPSRYTLSFPMVHIFMSTWFHNMFPISSTISTPVFFSSKRLHRQRTKAKGRNAYHQWRGDSPWPNWWLSLACEHHVGDWVEKDGNDTQDHQRAMLTTFPTNHGTWASKNSWPQRSKDGGV